MGCSAALAPDLILAVVEFRFSFAASAGCPSPRFAIGNRGSHFAGRTAHFVVHRSRARESCRAEMQRRPSLFFELPAQPAGTTSALHRRLSELFSLTASDDIEDAPFCRRTCGCCERPLGSGGVFMAFDKNCAPSPHQLAAAPRPDPNPNLNCRPPTHVSRADLSRPACAQTARRRAARPRSAPRSRRRRPVCAAEARIARGHRVLLCPYHTSGRRLRRRSRCRLTPLCRLR